MKRIVSVFLSVLMILCCVVPVSATALDSSQDGNLIDITPYIENPYIDTSSLSSGSISYFYIDYLHNYDIQYFNMIVRTDDTYPRFKSQTSLGGITINHIEDDLYSVYGSANENYRNSLYMEYHKSTGTYLEILSLQVSQCDYTVEDITFYFNIQGSYTYYSYNDPNSSPVYKVIRENLNVTNTYVGGGLIMSPMIHPNVTNGYVSDSYIPNERNFMTTSYLYFDWTSFDRVDIRFWCGYDNLRDFVFYVDGVNVLESIQDFGDEDHSYYVVSLDFSDLDPNTSSHLCYGMFRGHETMNSDSYHEFFRVNDIVGFTRTVSNNFWPSWLIKFLNKLDNLFSSSENIFARLGDVLTGRSSDQSSADSFNDSIDDQSSELEDMTDTMDSVETIPIEDVNTDIYNFVNGPTINVVTASFTTLLSNSILLRVLLVAFTFCLMGFILYGKK